MTVGSILLIVLVLLSIAAVPRWAHSKAWGYGPSAGLALGTIAVVALMMMGRL